ncbi:MAG TPA: hypothetical protein VMW10_11400, partial [Alphaproteobacteria bacterium]|nr:hypothetical protein [Alphaproteobacteria bacterium]
MAEPKHTTVVLSKTVQKIKDELSPIYGLKNILSAGLWLFSRLSDTEQKKAVAQVNELALADEADEIVSGAEADAIRCHIRKVTGL